MAIYKYLQNAWKLKDEPALKDVWRARLIAWRREPATVRIERPTRIDRARALGYKPKLGIIVVRQRVRRGGHERTRTKLHRRPKKMSKTVTLAKNYKLIAEERAARAFPNCEVLNSYFVAKDGKYYWFEVILVDRSHSQIIADKQLGFLALPAHRRRVFRGLTAAGKRMRGLRWRGLGAEKLRPSKNQNRKVRKELLRFKILK